MTGRRATLFLCLVLGLMLVWLAVPRTIAAALRAPHDATVRALGDYRPPGLAAILEAVEAHRAALTWRDSAVARSQLATLILALERTAGATSREGEALAGRAARNWRRSLAMAPGQRYGWTSLIQAQAVANDGADFHRPFAMALATGRVDPVLVPARIEVALALWPTLDDATRTAMRDQIALAARHIPADLATIARRRFALKQVRDALAEQPALRQRFDQAYLRTAP